MGAGVLSGIGRLAPGRAGESTGGVAAPGSCARTRRTGGSLDRGAGTGRAGFVVAPGFYRSRALGRVSVFADAGRGLGAGGGGKRSATTGGVPGEGAGASGGAAPRARLKA